MASTEVDNLHRDTVWRLLFDRSSRACTVYAAMGAMSVRVEVSASALRK